jgi:hypothetical protein
MASPPTIERDSQADWALMTAIHDALRRDLDQLIHTTASRTAARARWIVFRDQLHLHLAAEHMAMWRPARAKLTGDPRGQALLEAMEDEHQLIGPLRAVTDDAFAMGADPGRLRHLLTRLRTRLTSHLALRKPTRCRSSATSCPLPNSAPSPRPSAAGPQNARSRGPSPTPARTSAPKYCANCPHPPVCFTGRSGCRASPATSRRCEHHPTQPPPMPPVESTSERSAKEASDVCAHRGGQG